MLKFYEVQRLVDAFTREMGMFPRDAVITGETLKLHTGALTEVGFVELLIPNALFKRLSGRGEKGDLSEPFKYSEELTLIAFGENEPHRLIAYIGYVQHHFEKREGGGCGYCSSKVPAGFWHWGPDSGWMHCYDCSGV